jgi:hypothetical protein
MPPPVHLNTLVSCTGLADSNTEQPTLKASATTGGGGSICPQIASLDYLAATTQAADANSAITAAAVLAGIYLRSGMTAGRQDTLPSAAALVAAINGAQPGQCVNNTAIYLTVINQNGSAQTLTLAAGAGGTLNAVGTWTVPQNNAKAVLLVITNAVSGTEAYTVYSLGAASAA